MAEEKKKWVGRSMKRKEDLRLFRSGKFHG